MFAFLAQSSPYSFKITTNFQQKKTVSSKTKCFTIIPHLTTRYPTKLSPLHRNNEFLRQKASAFTAYSVDDLIIILK